MVEKRSGTADPQTGATMPQFMNAHDVALILKIAPKTVHKLYEKENKVLFGKTAGEPE